MRPVTIKSAYYTPEPIPADIKELQRYLDQELFKIRTCFETLALGHVDKTYVAPVKPREGDFRLADGTSWNPGSGAGFYGYYGGAWVKLG